jgi:hypothetical protein
MLPLVHNQFALLKSRRPVFFLAPEAEVPFFRNLKYALSETEGYIYQRRIVYHLWTRMISPWHSKPPGNWENYPKFKMGHLIALEDFDICDQRILNILLEYGQRHNIAMVVMDFPSTLNECGQFFVIRKAINTNLISPKLKKYLFSDTTSTYWNSDLYQAKKRCLDYVYSHYFIVQYMKQGVCVIVRNALMAGFMHESNKFEPGPETAEFSGCYKPNIIFAFCPNKIARQIASDNYWSNVQQFDYGTVSDKYEMTYSNFGQYLRLNDPVALNLVNSVTQYFSY